MSDDMIQLTWLKKDNVCRKLLRHITTIGYPHTNRTNQCIMLGCVKILLRLPTRPNKIEDNTDYRCIVVIITMHLHILLSTNKLCIVYGLAHDCTCNIFKKKENWKQHNHKAGRGTNGIWLYTWLLHSYVIWCYFMLGTTQCCKTFLWILFFD